MLAVNPDFQEYALKKTSKTYLGNAYASARAFVLYQSMLDRRYSWAGDVNRLEGRQ
jgi:hypothetical protein